MSGQSQLYVMTKPPPPVRRLLCGCRSAHGLHERYPPDRLHCTMLWLGNYDAWSPSQLERLRWEFGEIRFDPFEVRFERLEGRLLRGREGMAAPALFHRILRRHAMACGVPLPAHEFRLHLSLAYDGPALTGTRKIDPIGWPVEEFLLIRSHRGHEELGRWPLIERQHALAL